MTNRPSHAPEPGATDLLEVLTAIGPSTDIDQLWDPREQAAVRDRITADAEPAHAPGDELASRRRKHRPLVVLAVSSLVVAGGAGAAAAGGLMPQAFTDAFASWHHWNAEDGSHTVDVGSAQRAATAPGPDGKVFTVMVAAATDDPDYTCAVALFETTQSAVGPGPADFVDVTSNGCTNESETGPFGSGVNVDVSYGYYVWSTPAGDAVSGKLTTASGQTYPVVRADGNLYGWFPALAAGETHPELVGYAADGTEVGRESI